MAIPVFPDQNLSTFIKDFIEQLEEDFQSPGVSRFQDYMPKCRAGLQTMEEVSASCRNQVSTLPPILLTQNLSLDKSLVHKLTGSMKELFRCGEGMLWGGEVGLAAGVHMNNGEV